MSDLTITRLEQARIPTADGEFELVLYTSQDQKDHLAVVMGNVNGEAAVTVRVHSECFTGDVLGSQRCDCGEQLDRAMAIIGEAGCGVIIYLRQEGRGIGLRDKLRAYNLQDEGYDTVDANLALGHEADERDYTIAALILRDLGVQSVQLLTNNPAKIDALEAHNITVNARVPLQSSINQHNEQYLETKARRMRHMLKLNGRSHPTRNNGDSN